MIAPPVTGAEVAFRVPCRMMGRAMIGCSVIGPMMTGWMKIGPHQLKEGCMGTYQTSF